MARRLAVILVLALAAQAAAQDREPTHDDPAERNVPPHPRVTAPAERGLVPSSYDPNDEASSPDAPTPVGPPPAPAPAPGEKPAEEASKIGDVDVKANGRARVELGYDTNVFRAQSGKKEDGFFHGYGEADLLVTFPGERELFASVSGEGIHYFHNAIANETYAESFIDYYNPLTSVFDVDVQNTFAYSAQNLLDDNGDLLPRAKFDSYDEEARATLIAHAGQRLSFELSGGGRYNAFEDNPGLPSLSFFEIRGSGGVRYKPWADARLRIRYVFRDRLYTELPANARDGSVVAGDPKLELQRHQFLATFSQKLDLFGMRFVAQLGYTFTFNQDMFQNDRTYHENAVTAHLEWWPFPDWTELLVDLRGGNRAFLVRRTLVRGDPLFGTRLEQNYLDVTVAFQQKIVEHISVVVEASWFIYESTDIRSSYERFVAQGGIEASF